MSVYLVLGFLIGTSPGLMTPDGIPIPYCWLYIQLYPHDMPSNHIKSLSLSLRIRNNKGR